MAKWSAAEIETFLTIFASYKPLYNVKHPDYIDASKRANMLKSLAEELKDAGL